MDFIQQNELFMREAIKEANEAFREGEVPIGCVIVKGGEVIARAHNRKEYLNDVTSHAEIEAIRLAEQVLNTWHLDGCSLYVTLEPCPMCAGAIMQSRLDHIYYGAYDSKGGALGSLLNLYEVKGFNYYPMLHDGILEEECKEILSEFFKMKRISR